MSVTTHSSVPHTATVEMSCLDSTAAPMVNCTFHQASLNAPVYHTKTVNVEGGKNIGKRLHVVNFTFTLLDEGQLAFSSEGKHTPAVERNGKNAPVISIITLGD